MKKPAKPSVKRKFEDLKTSSTENKHSGCFFHDGVRRVDYVIAWEESLETGGEVTEDQKQKATYRRKFEDNLIGSGVEIEREVSLSTKRKIHFLKLYITWETMCYYAEYLGIRAPLSERDEHIYRSSIEFFSTPMDLELPNKPKMYYSCAFSAAKLGRYVNKENQDTYFKPTQRFEVAFKILGTQVYGRKDLCEVGISSMIRKGIYTCAYPPHDGPSKTAVPLSAEKLNARQVLHEYWARWSLWYKYQPLDHIREYFGEKIGFYFAFLGYYTTWLVPASICGILTFIYACAALSNHPVVDEVCSSGRYFRMCPLCKDEKDCGYWFLSDICGYVHVSYLADNDATFYYALFVSFWACFFLEGWKRKSATLDYQWDVLDYVGVQERPRPEYTSQCTEYAEDPVTGNLEPHFPIQKRRPRLVFGVLSLLLMMMLSATSLLVMLISRSFILYSLFQNELFRSRALTLANATSAIINLVLVLLLELLYEKLAFYITEWEMHRTQTAFENQVILKVFIFEFFNHFVYIAYTAVVKGNISGQPGEYTLFFGMRPAECANGSCMFELAQIIAVIVVGKQIAVNIIELVLPKLLTCIHRLVAGLKHIDETRKTGKQWESDFTLIPYDQILFMEYLETVLQFAFITLFVPAFPLAPLFALLNNLMKIRMDARKLVLGSRRPVPERTQGIGVWLKMLTFVVHMSTISNAFLICFTSEYLPMMLYRAMYNTQLHGYKNFTLSWAKPNTTSKPCRFNGLFSTSGSFDQYFWKLLALRVILLLAFQQVVLSVSSLIGHLIPDMPEELALKVKRQKYLAKQALIGQELAQSRNKRVAFVA